MCPHHCVCMCVCVYVKVLRLLLPHPASALLESVIFFQDLQFLVLEIKI